MDLVKDLEARGLVEYSSAELDKIFSQKRTVYLGVDPSADSMQIGNLAVVVLMKRLADAGHKPILLAGGGTGLIGDPREKGERPMQTEEIIADRTEKIGNQFRRLLGRDVTVVNNIEWLKEVSLLPFLRDVGKHFTVNELVKRDIIKRRLADENDSISYTEFTYSLLQAYDYRELNQRYGCDLQVGGSDQWTNILSGVDLIRKRDGREVFALSIPLITDSAGRKFGKSEGNAVWLDAEKTTPYQFHQFWLNVEDDKAVEYLKTYTLLSLEEIAAIEQEFNQDRSSRLAQKRLADEVTQFVHGDAPLEATSYVTEANASVVDVLVSGGLASSKREAREFIENGAVTIDGEVVTDINAPIRPGVIQRGKRKMNSLKVEIK